MEQAKIEITRLMGMKNLPINTYKSCISILRKMENKNERKRFS